MCGAAIPRVQLSAIIDGGGHERGMRSGTLNVTGIVGLGKACELCQQEMAEEGATAEQVARPAEEPAWRPSWMKFSSTVLWSIGSRTTST